MQLQCLIFEVLHWNGTVLQGKFSSGDNEGFFITEHGTIRYCHWSNVKQVTVSL